MSYRRIAEHIRKIMLHRNLSLKSVPHFTTLHKFVERVDMKIIHRIINYVAVSYLRNKPVIAAIDGTGITLREASQHYLYRVNAIKNFAKLSILTDTKTRIIIDAKSHAHRAHDNVDFKPLIGSLRRLNTIRLCADKAYDSNENFRILFENGIEPQIPVRQKTKTSVFKGKYRRKSTSIFNEKAYHQRSIVESVFSSLKRMFGGYVNDDNKNFIEKNALIKVMVYNLTKVQTLNFCLLRLIGFLHARNGINGKMEDYARFLSMNF